jgi:hypothetical protein
LKDSQLSEVLKPAVLPTSLKKFKKKKKKKEGGGGGRERERGKKRKGKNKKKALLAQNCFS